MTSGIAREGHSPSDQSRPRRIATLALLLAGLPIAGALALWISMELILPAWGVCGEDLGLVPGLELVFRVLPAIALSSYGGYAIVVVGLFRRPKLVRVLAGLALAAVASLVATTFFVPALGEGDPYYQQPGPRATATCGLQGMPTWWPGWLPH